METMKKCKYCGGDGDVMQEDNGFYIAGCDRTFDCENNIFLATEEFATEEEAIEWWNRRN